MLARLALILAAAAAATGAEELVNDRVAAVEPFPREVARGKTVVVKGIVKGSFRDPELILIAPNGKTYLNKDNEVSGFRFEFTVRFDEGTGPYRLELIAKAPEATRTALRTTVHHGQRAPPEPEKPEPPPVFPKTPGALHERVLEKRFQRLLNEFRRGIGCDPVGWNEAVAARAREHALRMAVAERRQHHFGGVGVLEELGKAGAGDGLSGPATPWGRTNSVRPFDRPAPQRPGPRVWNHVVVMNVASDSLEEMFHRFFVGEAAFRICAADPHCLEVAVGAARTPRPPPPRGRTAPPASPLVYYCVCFVQVNEKTVIEQQDAFFEELLARAANLDPDLLRALGSWGRPTAADLLERAWKDPRAEVASAAVDALLVLDEEKTRGAVEARLAEDKGLVEAKRYRDALAVHEPFRWVLYDGRFGAGYARVVREATRAARTEIRALRGMKEPERAAAAEELRSRARGLGLDAEIDKALGK
jgi:hypothetical protein